MAEIDLQSEALRLADDALGGALVFVTGPQGMRLEHAQVSVEGMVSAGVMALISALGHAQAGAATCTGCADTARRLNAALDALNASAAARAIGMRAAEQQTRMLH